MLEILDGAWEIVRCHTIQGLTIRPVQALIPMIPQILEV